MARGRFISESVATDARLNSLSVEAELVYLMAIPHLDRDGLIEGDPNVLWGKVCPKRRQFLDAMPVYIQEWARAGLVLMYDTSNGPVLWFKGFVKNQLGLRYERETPSKFPPPPQNEVRQTSGNDPDASGNCRPELEVKDQVQDQGGDRVRAHESPPPAAIPPPVSYQVDPVPGEYMPGVKRPVTNQTRQFVDGIARQRAQLGLSAVQFTQLTDCVLDEMNATAIAGQDTDLGADELKQAQQAALALAGLGHKTPQGIGAVFDSWYAQDWRGQKGEPPTYRLLVEHARNMKPRTDRSQQTSADQELATLAKEARRAQRELTNALSKNWPIDPRWQHTIDRAKEMRVL